MSFGSHAYVADARNDTVFFNVNGELKRRMGRGQGTGY